MERRRFNICSGAAPSIERSGDLDHVGHQPILDLLATFAADAYIVSALPANEREV